MPGSKESLSQVDHVRRAGSVLGGVAVAATLENFIPSGLAFGAGLLSMLPLNYIFLTLGVHNSSDYDRNQE